MILATPSAEACGEPQCVGGFSTVEAASRYSRAIPGPGVTGFRGGHPPSAVEWRGGDCRYLQVRFSGTWLQARLATHRHGALFSVRTASSRSGVIGRQRPPEAKSGPGLLGRIPSAPSGSTRGRAAFCPSVSISDHLLPCSGVTRRTPGPKSILGHGVSRKFFSLKRKEE